MIVDFDVIVVGSGFGGSLTAMIAKRLGLSVLLVERGTHPRFAIGESTAPLTNLLIEELSARYDLPALLPFTTYGAWQRNYPEVVGGLKRGFTYYAHEKGKRYQPAPDRANQLLVAASPNDDLADTHWLRSDVDSFLVNCATSAGVEYLDNTQAALNEMSETGAVLELNSGPVCRAVRGRFLIDATGPRGFLHHALKKGEGTLPHLPKTQSLFSHFSGVRRTDAMADYAVDGAPPYGPDDAALHHVFEGGWMWVLRFNNGVTSAGVSVEERMGGDLGLAEGAAAWDRILERFPSIQEQFESARPEETFRYMPRLSYRTRVAAGDAWAMLPSAAAFIDPLFSTGFPLTLLGIERLAVLLETTWGTENFGSELKKYGEQTLSEADWTAEFIAGSFAGMGDFPNFAAYSMYYFAAASYSEMARRLDRKYLAGGFLGISHPKFRDGLRISAQRLTAANGGQMMIDSDAFQEQVAQAIEGLNVAGLADRRKRNWYGVNLQDVIDNAARLDMTREEARDRISNASWVGSL